MHHDDAEVNESSSGSSTPTSEIYAYDIEELHLDWDNTSFMT
jgi:hypothetical protein